MASQKSGPVDQIEVINDCEERVIAMVDETQKFSWDIGKHPSVIELEAKLRKEVDMEAPQPPPGLPEDENMAIYERRREAFSKAQSQWCNHADEIASEYDKSGFPGIAFCSETILSEVLADTYDPFSFTYNLLFFQNYRFGHSTELDNQVQRDFITSDEWLGRVGNSGAGTMFLDPCPQFLDVWATLYLLDWLEIEQTWRHAITTIMRTSSAAIEESLAINDRKSATKHLVDHSFGPDKYAHYGIPWEDFTHQDQKLLSEIEDFTNDRFEELEARILASIWKHRSHLIQPHPDNMNDPRQWRLMQE